MSRIDIVEGSEFAEPLLLIRSLDDLKGRLAKVVLLILAVKFYDPDGEVQEVERPGDGRPRAYRGDGHAG